jgi:hypothetical protein
MPKTKSQRTFTACWTCRRRNAHCDKAVPHCSQCKRMHIPCQGYHIRLVWVDFKSGAYTPRQRRTNPCHLTWKGYPSWMLKEIGHLIDACELSQCRCKLHKVPSPFCVFPQKAEETQFPSEVGGNALESIPKPLLGNEGSYFHIGSLIPSVTEMDDLIRSEDRHEQCPKDQYIQTLYTKRK